jgi:hypothetical protein
LAGSNTQFAKSSDEPMYSLKAAVRRKANNLLLWSELSLSEGMWGSFIQNFELGHVLEATSGPQYLSTIR